MFYINLLNLDVINENLLTLIHFSGIVVVVTPIIYLANKSDKNLKILQGAASGTVVTRGLIDLINYGSGESGGNSEGSNNGGNQSNNSGNQSNNNNNSNSNGNNNNSNSNGNSNNSNSNGNSNNSEGSNSK